MSGDGSPVTGPALGDVTRARTMLVSCGCIPKIPSGPGFAIQAHSVQCSRTACEGCQALFTWGKNSCSPWWKKLVQCLGTKILESEHISRPGSSKVTADQGLSQEMISYQ